MIDLVIVVYSQVSNFSAISWGEEVTLWSSSLKQQSMLHSDSLLLFLSEKHHENKFC